MAYETIADVIADPQFAKADLELRRGKHISASPDIFLYDFIATVQPYLERFYEAYNVRLVCGSEGYFYLLPDKNHVPPPLGNRHLSAVDMLVGQTLALMRLDPKWLADNGRIPESSIIELMEHILGQERLLGYIERRRGKDTAVDARKLREVVRSSLAELKRLGFIHREGQGETAVVMPYVSIMRFADPVRGSESLEDALTHLLREGEIEEIADKQSDSPNSDSPDNA
ncbi:chromosome partition protein MukE [Chromobacterium violaceum]|uniref:chromosome partition protein MukE n=1 Tax=Chromobacterium violaceum TaxID=536 RepID=UPI001B322DBD|nr:chromosome partition protein MukE [Chromobacterium violaceum]MBP4045423.1 chromosome partition protein MukE [Chromobacterium violaceum]